MSSWFSKATNVFRREAEETAQPFQLYCACGQEHQGIRRQRHQHIVCKACGQALFVLPRDVYPPPKEEKRPRIKEEEPVIVAEEEATILPQAALTRPVKEQERRSSPTIAERPPSMEAEEMDQVPVARREPVKKSKPKPPPPPPVVPAGVKLKEFWSKNFTATRLVMLGLLSVVFLMAFILFRQQGERTALLTLQTEVEAGRVALAQEKILDARDHFEKAVAAFDLLGRQDAEANEIRQLFRETQALTRLSSGSLLELAEEGEAFLKQHQGDQEAEKKLPQLLTEHLRTRHSLDWYIIEGPVRPRKVNSGKEGKVEAAYELVLPWTWSSPRRSLQVIADFPCLKNFAKGSEPKNVVLSARFKECVLDGDTWVIRLEPSDAFLWVYPQTYRTLGFPLAPEDALQLEQHLQAQGLAMGISP